MQPIVSRPVFPTTRPFISAPAAPMVPPLPVLIGQLGTQTRININGLVQFNESLVQQITAYREMAVPALVQFLNTVQAIPALLEGLWTGQRLAQTGVRGVEQLYPAVSRWNTNPDPLVQIYLAGLYRYLNEPAAFGPMLATLIHRSVTQYPLQSSPNYTITEEVGGTVLQQLAHRTAEETVKRLIPYLQPTRPPQPNPSQLKGINA